jgi:hypothetical protein
MASDMFKIDHKYEKYDKFDLVRGWGWNLLSTNDKIFMDKTYINNLLSCHSNNAIIGSCVKHEIHITQFNDIWKKIAPKNVEPPITFYLTGSDANNSLYDLALEVIQETHPERKLINGEIMCMDKIWGGGRGKIRGMGFFKSNKLLDDFRIPCPYVECWDTTNADLDLDDIETVALNKIKKCVHENNNVGGLLIETIIGPFGVYFFRQRFMKKLRELCDELCIPIIADEILTGGGRTGKFFAYEHYPNFEPDYITFGKGLTIAGLTRVIRHNHNPYPLPKLVAFGPTLYHYNECLIRATLILTKIYDCNLMHNAVVMGEHFLKQLRDYAKDKLHKDNVEKYIRGKGLLIYVKDSYKPRSIRTGMGRVMPELTITQEIINEIFIKKPCNCENCRKVCDCKKCKKKYAKKLK